MPSDLHDIQSRFAAYLRNPDKTLPPDDVPLDRVHVYRDLVFRNINSLLSNNFPVVAECTGKDWRVLVRGFIRDHRAQTPHFPQLPDEFLNYLDCVTQDVNCAEYAIVERYPFITELAHYEWVELNVQIAPLPVFGTTLGKVNTSDRLALNSTAQLLVYTWPVHQIGPAFQPLQQPDTPTFLAVFLNTQMRVEFMLLTPLAALLLGNTEQFDISVAEHIEKLADHSGDQSPNNLAAALIILIEKLRSKGLIYVKSSAVSCRAFQHQ